MKKYAYILMLVVAGHQSQAANSPTYTTVIEGERVFFAKDGGNFSAVVKRLPSKEEIKVPGLTYAWGKSGGNSSKMAFSSRTSKDVVVTAENGIVVTNGLSAQISCAIQFNRKEIGKPKLQIRMKAADANTEEGKEDK